mmetsp:Transcript_1008/g.2926  ORF Transcript_1008/g.2926 Transcript_1008/m.2926 type:complete len:345 (-) Transcript_1008:2-1036(-)
MPDIGAGIITGMVMPGSITGIMDGMPGMPLMPGIEPAIPGKPPIMPGNPWYCCMGVDASGAETSLTSEIGLNGSSPPSSASCRASGGAKGGGWKAGAGADIGTGTGGVGHICGGSCCIGGLDSLGSASIGAAGASGPADSSGILDGGGDAASRKASLGSATAGDPDGTAATGSCCGGSSPASAYLMMYSPKEELPWGFRRPTMSLCWSMTHCSFVTLSPLMNVPNDDWSLMNTRFMTSPSSAPFCLQARKVSLECVFEIFLSLSTTLLLSKRPTEIDGLCRLNVITEGRLCGAPAVRVSVAIGAEGSSAITGQASPPKEPPHARARQGLARRPASSCVHLRQMS